MEPLDKPTIQDLLKDLGPPVALLGADLLYRDLLLYGRAAVHRHLGIAERVPPQGIICLTSPGQLPAALEEAVKAWLASPREDWRVFIDTPGMQGISCSHDPSIKQPNRHARRRADRIKR